MLNLEHTNVSTPMLTAALTAAGAGIISSGECSWSCIVDSDGAPMRIGAHLEYPWLVLESDAGTAATEPPTWWSVLERADGLPGLIKVPHPGSTGVKLRMEIPLLENTDIHRRLQEGFLGFLRARELWATGRAAGSQTVAQQTPSLLRLCSEAGWKAIERTPEKLVVDLEVTNGGFYQASIISVGPRVRLSCDLAHLESAHRLCRQAIAGLLLSVASVVRLVRTAIVSANDASPVLRLGVEFETIPSSFEISSALESLSVGCSLCGEEIKSLHTPAIAQQFLKLHGWDN